MHERRHIGPGQDDDFTRDGYEGDCEHAHRHDAGVDRFIKFCGCREPVGRRNRHHEYYAGICDERTREIGVRLAIGHWNVRL